MNQVRLEFQGTGQAGLLLTLLIAVMLITLAWGLWQFVRRRRRYAMVCVASAAGPIGALPVLLAFVAHGYASDQTGRARRDLLGAAGILLLPILGLAMLFVLVLVSLLLSPLGFSEAFGASASALVSSMSFQAGGLWLLAVLAQVGLAAGVFYCGVYGPLSTPKLAQLLSLRVAAIFLLLLILFKPAVALTLGDPEEKPYLSVLVDRSGSMGVIDQPGRPSRWQQALGQLRKEHTRLKAHFRPVYHHFALADRQVQSVSELFGQDPENRSEAGTDLAGPLRNASAAFAASRSVGIVVLTDGGDNLNPLARLESAASQASVPIYPVGIGSLKERPASGPAGATIARVEAPLRGVVGNTMRIQVGLDLRGRAGQTSRLVLEDSSGRELAAQDVYAEESSASLAVDLAYTPEYASAGEEDDVRRLRLRLLPIGSEPSAQSDLARVPLHFLLTRPTLRVVYVEGSIRSEYKFVRRQLDSDPNIRLMTLIRMSGSRFNVMGSLDGYKATSLPDSPEDFAAMDVLILGDLDASYLTQAQMEQIATFVREGGGLLMIGGSSSFGPGGYGATPIEDVLPVLMGTRAMGPETTQFLPQLTAAGLEHPIFEGIAGWFAGPGGLEPTEEPELPKLTGCVRTLQAKAGTVLAIHPSRRNENGPLTVLAVQRTGDGRSAAFTADTTWRWFLQMRAVGVRGPHGRFWGQLIRWLAGADSNPGQAKAALSGRLLPTRSAYRIGDPVEMRCLVRDDSGQLTGDAVVTATVSPADSTQAPKIIPLVWDPSSRSWSAVFHPDLDGTWTVEFAAKADGRTLAADTLRAEVRAYQVELENTARRQDLLEELARRSGGRTVLLDGFGALVDDLIQQGLMRQGRGPETQNRPLHHFALLFGLFCVALTSEWFLRRRWQLH